MENIFFIDQIDSRIFPIAKHKGTTTYIISTILPVFNYLIMVFIMLFVIPRFAFAQPATEGALLAGEARKLSAVRNTNMCFPECMWNV